MKTLRAILLLVIAVLAVVYLIARPWTPFWVDMGVILIGLGIALFKWMNKR
jgi:hypothetical protein